MEKAQRKQSAALSSMVAAIFLAAAKLAAGLLTGSLGLLSEALHSGLDLIGTILSFLAIRVADKPPDKNHPYGHGKAESLVALFAVVLLSVTSLGILFEAYQKIFVRPEVPDSTWYGFAVLAFALVIDLSRSRYLARVARETNSQALAADAAHFASDLWSSGTVLLSLTLIFIGQRAGWPAQWLSIADAGAGVIVAVVIFQVAWHLAQRAVNSLMDEVPPRLLEQVSEAAAGVQGVVQTDSARLRYMGDRAYADLIVNVDRNLSLEASDQLSDDVIDRVREVVPGADVVVHTHPVQSTNERATDLVRVIAHRLDVDVHHVRIFDSRAGLRLDMHMEVPARQTLAEAHAVADSLETNLRGAMPNVAAVEVHIEPRHDDVHSVSRVEDPALEAQVINAAEALAGPGSVRRVEIAESSHGLLITIHCSLPGAMPITDAHSLTADIERDVRDTVPHAYRVTVHPEPEAGDGGDFAPEATATSAGGGGGRAKNGKSS